MTLRANSPWGRPEVIEELKTLHARGDSALQIAQVMHSRFGLQVSRDSVVGIVHRLGLSKPTPAKPSLRRVEVKAATARRGNGHIMRQAAIGRAKAIVAERQAGESSRRKVDSQGGGRAVLKRAAATARIILGGNGSAHEVSGDCKPLPAPDRVELEPLVASIMDLRHSHCRWPIAGEYCGRHRRDDQTSYCDHHHGIAYVGRLPNGLRPSASELARSLRRVL